jgi:hypothetical protein
MTDKSQPDTARVCIITDDGHEVCGTLIPPKAHLASPPAPLGAPPPGSPTTLTSSEPSSASTSGGPLVDTQAVPTPK